MDAWIIWLVLCGALLLLELATGTLGALCGACGCVVAFFFAVAGCGFDAQLISAAAGIVLSLVFLAPLVNRYRHRRQGRAAGGRDTNMDALIGREAVLTREITAASPGRVKVDGDNWQARAARGGGLPRGTMVRVTGYDSIILTVKPVNED